MCLDVAQCQQRQADGPDHEPTNTWMPGWDQQRNLQRSLLVSVGGANHLPYNLDMLGITDSGLQNARLQMIFGQ